MVIITPEITRALKSSKPEKSIKLIDEVTDQIVNFIINQTDSVQIYRWLVELGISLPSRNYQDFRVSDPANQHQKYAVCLDDGVRKNYPIDLFLENKPEIDYSYYLEELIRVEEILINQVERLPESFKRLKYQTTDRAITLTFYYSPIKMIAAMHNQLDKLLEEFDRLAQ